MLLMTQTACQIRVFPIYHMDRIKQKGLFKHAQNARILIHPTHVQSVIQAFALQ